MGLNHNRSQYPSREKEIALVHEAVERGVTLFDTAESYGYHINEKLVGEALKGYTDRVFVSSKFGHKFVNGVQIKPKRTALRPTSAGFVKTRCAISELKHWACSTSTA